MPETNPHIHEHTTIYFQADDYSDTTVSWCHKCGCIALEVSELTNEGEMVTIKRWNVGSSVPFINNRSPIRFSV